MRDAFPAERVSADSKKDPLLSIPLKTLVDMVMRNEIDDGKTIAAVLKADKYLQNR